MQLAKHLRRIVSCVGVSLWSRLVQADAGEVDGPKLFLFILELDMTARNVRRAECRRGFSMVECAAVVLVLSMIGMTMGPTLKQVRGQMRGAGSSANLMSIGQGAAAYGFFNQGNLFSYSWRAGETYVMPDGRHRTETTDTSAAVRQNQEILMRLTGRVSGASKIRADVSRIPHKRFNHLVLVDFLNDPVDSAKYIDPADANQLYWTANPLAYLEEGSGFPYADGQPADAGYDTDANWPVPGVVQRWAFSSSYQVVPDAWNGPVGNRFLPIASTPYIFTGSNSVPLGRRTIDEVAFPSQKVWMFEEFDREQVGNPYFGYNHARSEKLMFDGSVNGWASGDANPSIVPEFGLQPWKQTYVPLDTFPVPLGGLGDPTLLSQRYRWTFRGLAGVDYGLAVPGRGPRAKGP
jgi:hypothetical protein